MGEIEGADTPEVTLRQVSEVASPLVVYEFQVQGSTAGNRRVDVLFIHGLTGDPIKTWGDWPKKFALQFSERARVWSLGYRAPLLEQPGVIKQGFDTKGAEALDALVNAGFGKRPIVFVAHSLGGLLAKSIIAQASRGKPVSAELSIFAKTHAVIFVATPHAGSGQARWRLLVPAVVNYAAKGAGAVMALKLAAVGFLSIPLTLTVFGRTWKVGLGAIIFTLLASVGSAVLKSLTRPGVDVLMLDPSNPGLASLTREFRQAQFKRGFAVDSFYEQKRLWRLFLVVPQWSADPGITDCDPKPIYADHIGICKHPNIEKLQLAIQKRVSDAFRGKDTAVFGEHIKRLLKQPKEHEAFTILFEGKRGNRDQAEQKLRPLLRTAIAKGHFVPTESELDLAIDSCFDEDIVVWSLSYERKIASALRRLREYASDEVENDFRSAMGNDSRSRQAAAGWTLIPFYRVLRTVEHILSGDLLSAGYGSELDRDQLLRTVDKAFEKLQRLAPDELREFPLEERQKLEAKGRDYQGQAPIDLYGKTRRLLLRLRYMVLLAHAAQEFAGMGKHDEKGDELVQKLYEKRGVFNRGLEKFKNQL